MIRALILVPIAFMAMGCEPQSSNRGAPSTGSPAATSQPSPRSNASTGGTNAPPSMPEQRAPVPGTAPQPSRTGDGTVPASSTVSDAHLLAIMLLKDREEAAIGRLAQQKASSDAAKRLGDMLVTEHTDHANKVTETAQSAGITLPEEDAAKRELDRLKGGPAGGVDPLAILQPLSGAAFDAKFGELMVQGHGDVIKLLEEAMPRIGNAQVRTLVEQTLPVLRGHEEMARQVAGPPSSPR